MASGIHPCIFVVHEIICVKFSAICLACGNCPKDAHLNELGGVGRGQHKKLCFILFLFDGVKK